MLRIKSMFIGIGFILFVGLVILAGWCSQQNILRNKSEIDMAKQIEVERDSLLKIVYWLNMELSCRHIICKSDFTIHSHYETFIGYGILNGFNDGHNKDTFFGKQNTLSGFWEKK